MAATSAIGDAGSNGDGDSETLYICIDSLRGVSPLFRVCWKALRVLFGSVKKLALNHL